MLFRSHPLSPRHTAEAEDSPEGVTFQPPIQGQFSPVADMRHERGADLRCLKYVRQPGASIISLIMRQGSEALPESLQVSGTSVSSI